jgi:hypothetical protein
MLRTGLVLAGAVLAAAGSLLAQAPAAKTPVPNRFDQALAQRAEGKQSPEDVRIDASWRRGTEIIECRVYGTGIGIWRDKTQFSLTREQVVGLLKELQKARFGDMPKWFGNPEGEGEEDEDRDKESEKKPEKEKEHPKEKVYLRGSLFVRVASDSKRVAQYMEGEQETPFAALVARILDTAEKAAAGGRGAASLPEGLAAVAEGKLAPETLQVMVQRRAGSGDPKKSSGHWLMRIDGRRVVDRSWAADGSESTRLVVLSEADFRQLVKLLHDSDLAGMPRNLYSADNVRIDLRVLDRRADLTARRYAGKTAQTLGAKQEAFDRVDAALVALHDRVAREGGTASSAE